MENENTSVNRSKKFKIRRMFIFVYVQYVLTNYQITQTLLGIYVECRTIPAGLTGLHTNKTK